MVNAELSRLFIIRVDDRVGSLAEVTSFISSSGINQIAVCAYEIEGMVVVMFVTEDNNEAKALLEEQGIKVQEEEAILLTLENKPGALQHVTRKIAEAGINLKLLYGTSDEGSKKGRIVILSENNLDVMMVIKTELERG